MERFWGGSWRWTLAKQLANGIGQGEMLQVKMLDSKNHKKLSLILICFQIFDPFWTWCCCLSSRDPSGAQVRLPDQMLVTLRFRRGLQLFNFMEFQHLCYIWYILFLTFFDFGKKGRYIPVNAMVLSHLDELYHSDMNTPGICWQNADAMTPSTGIDDSNSDATEAEEAEAERWTGSRRL